MKNLRAQMRGQGCNESKHAGSRISNRAFQAKIQIEVERTDPGVNELRKAPFLVGGWKRNAAFRGGAFEAGKI